MLQIPGPSILFIHILKKMAISAPIPESWKPCCLYKDPNTLCWTNTSNDAIFFKAKIHHFVNYSLVCDVTQYVQMTSEIRKWRIVGCVNGGHNDPHRTSWLCSFSGIEATYVMRYCPADSGERDRIGSTGIAWQHLALRRDLRFGKEN